MTFDNSAFVDYVLRGVRKWSATGLRPYVAAQIRKELASPRPLDDWVRFIFDYKVVLGPRPMSVTFSLRPIQRPAEIVQLLRIIAALQPRRIVEVGSAAGGTLFLFARAAASDAILVGVDLPPQPEGGGLSDWRAALYAEALGAPPQRVRMVRGDSHAPATVARVREALDGQAADFLFIDGDHSYAGVRRDYELFSPLVRTGGLIAFHDIVPDSYHRYGIRTEVDTGGVPLFWAELKALHQDNCRVSEIVEDPAQDGLGIGVMAI